jgi:two-component system chemotaxis response regulator CheB
MREKLILIGASTGGPGHLRKILGALDPNFCVPIIIAQHMNPTFIVSFAKQFNNELPLNVFLAEDRHPINRATTNICATTCHLVRKNMTLTLERSNTVDSYYNPSIDHLFHSASQLSEHYDILAILLTGIGFDGAAGLSALKDHGATCIAESEESAIVYGMPKKAVEVNPRIEVKNLNGIIKYIKDFGESNVF